MVSCTFVPPPGYTDHDLGARMMYEVILPEPASSLMLRMTASYNQKMHSLIKPPDLDILADDIAEHDWDDFALKYGVADMEPPLAPVKTISYCFKNSMIPPTGPAPFYTDTAAIDM